MHMCEFVTDILDVQLHPKNNLRISANFEHFVVVMRQK